MVSYKNISWLVKEEADNVEKANDAQDKANEQDNIAITKKIDGEIVVNEKAKIYEAMN